MNTHADLIVEDGAGQILWETSPAWGADFFVGSHRRLARVSFDLREKNVFGDIEIVPVPLEAFASKHDVGRATLDGLMTGLGFTLVLVVLGGMRELVGTGTLLSHANLMFGDVANDWTLTLIEDYRGFLLAILPPGAFLGLGLLIAIKNVIDKKLEQRRTQVIELKTPAVTDGA